MLIMQLGFTKPAWGWSPPPKVVMSGLGAPPLLLPTLGLETPVIALAVQHGRSVQALWAFIPGGSWHLVSLSVLFLTQHPRTEGTEG